MKPTFARAFAPALAALTLVGALLAAKWCGAAQPVKRPCSIVYINADVVISCPKVSR